MIDAGFTDNGGAIHSAERILDILGLRLNYPGTSHINKISKSEHAVFSIEARKLSNKGEKILIEHVAPQRALTQLAIKKIKTLNDAEFKKFIKQTYKLVLLSPEETKRLNALNRTRIAVKRLEQAKIKLEKPRSKKKK